MKESQANRVILLLSFLALVTRGKGISYQNRGQNSHILPYGQVNKTIQLKCGDVYDCIDVNLQPSLNHPQLKDHKIQMQPSSFPIVLDTEPQFPHSASQVQPSIIDCPVGTVPVLRNNISGTSAAHNIHVVGSMGIERAAVGIEYRGDVYGTTVKINVWEPKVNKDSKDLSATWVHINNGVGEHTDRIGAGIMVNPSLSGDTSVRFHISWDPKTKNWWVTDGKNTPLGYWPNGLFTFLYDKGDFAFWGGIVQGPTATSNAVEMGSGHFASEGYRRAAIMRNI
ncbi:hypothetical protein ACQ4PT_045851 [Festuca glaucescens]